MRYVERDGVEPPKWFAGDEARRRRHALWRFFQQDLESVSQKRVTETYEPAGPEGFGEEVQSALAHLFDNACAFCESPIGGRALIHRFRPTSSATPVFDTSTAHLYYAWLADAWQNLYPICSVCLPDDAFSFPVASDRRAPLPTSDQLEQFANSDDGRWPAFPLDEEPTLLDPCYDRRLWEHFEFTLGGEIYESDPRGEATIAHFKLDRRDLCDARSRAFDERCAILEEFLKRPDEVLPSEVLDVRKTPFAGAWRIVLREILEGAHGSLPDSGDLEEALTQLRGMPDALDRLVDTFQSMKDDAEVRFALEYVNPEELTRAGYQTRPVSNSLPATVEITNFKSLEKLEVRLPEPPADARDRVPALLMLGENAAGKSTILEAMALAIMGVRARRMLSLNPDDYVLNPSYLGGADARPSTSEIVVAFRGGATRTLTIKRDEGGQRSGFDDKGATNLIPLFAYGAFRQYLDRQRKATAHRYVRSLFQPDEPLSNPEKWLCGLEQSDFRMVARALRLVFSIESEFEVLERDLQTKRVYAVSVLGEEADGKRARTPLSMVSSGFRSILAMLCDIMHGLMDKDVNPRFQSLETARGLVLIDEIEAHLHPRWKMSIMTGLRQALPGVCFVATSHDPLCLRGMHKGEVLVLERVEETSALGLPIFTQALVDLPDNQNWTIQQLLTADFFQMRSTEGIVAERRRAKVEDLLASGASAQDDPAVRAYLEEISSTLPIGDTDVHRIVHEAIAQYLAERSKKTQTQLKALQQNTKQRILDALRGYDAVR